MKEYFEVKDKVYTDDNTSEYDCQKGWIPARPALYSPNLWEKFIHWLGKHWSYGQYFCIICGKERI